MNINEVRRMFPRATSDVLKKAARIKQADLELPQGQTSYAFIVHGEVVGKPRMTRQDKWAKRPCVVKYRQFQNRIKAEIPFPYNFDIGTVRVKAFMTMPPSWSDEWKKKMDGMPHRSTPDADNIMKGVCDSLTKQDSGIWKKSLEKFWCLKDERIEIEVTRYFYEKI